MKKHILSAVSMFMVFVMLFSVTGIFTTAQTPESTIKTDLKSKYSYLTYDEVDTAKCSNSIVIPGVFQSKVRLYNDDGTVAVNSDGEEYSGPFFLDGTNDIVKYALKMCLAPLLLTLITQKDWNDWFVNSTAEVLGNVLGGKITSDSNGNLPKNLRADKYEGSVAECTEEEKAYIYKQIPLNDFAAICGEDHLYFYSYCSFDNINRIVDELYAYIQKAAAASPTGKANIIPISQGGTLAVNLLERYPEVGQYLDKIIYIVPALDGSVLIGEIFEKGLIDDDVSIYNEMFPILVDDDDTPWMGDLVSVLLRILPNSVVNNLLDKAVDTLIEDHIENSTAMWALCPSGNYPGAAAKYLNDADSVAIKAQTDVHYQAQLHRYANIKYQMTHYGVEVFDVVDYNYTLYPIVDSWKELNADGIIQLDSTSMGATSVAVDVKLPEGYVPVAGGKYVDPYNLVDAGTGLLPDHTFYFHNQDHERTGGNDVIMKLAICLLTDDNFTSVESYPAQYPQFNEGRDIRGFSGDVKAMKSYDTSALSAEDKAELAAAIADCDAVINNTVVNTEKTQAASARFYAIRNKILQIPTEPTTEEKISDAANSSLAVFMKVFSKLLLAFFDGKGFSEIIRMFF